MSGLFMKGQKMIYVLSLTPCEDRTCRCDRFDPDRTNRVIPVRRDIGGKGVNCAGTLLALGEKATLAGADFEGRVAGAFRDKLPLLLTETGLPLRCNLKIFDRSRNKTVEVNEPAPPIGKALLSAIRERLCEKLREGDTLVLCGSLPMEADPGTYADFCSSARAKGARVAADCSGEALLRVAKQAPDLLKPNREEFFTLIKTLYGFEPGPDRKSLADAGKRLCREMGIGRILLSLGKDGAMLLTGEDSFFCDAPPVCVRGDIGAGDAMTAAAVLCLNRGESGHTLLRMASAAAGAVLEKEGTQPPDREEIAGILDRMP